MGDARGETVGHRGPLGLEQVEGVARVDGVGAHQGGAGDQGGQQTERESADPEERRVAEQPVVGGQPADRVEVPLMGEQRGVGVHRALRCARRPRGVDDGQRIGAVDVVLQRREQRLVDDRGSSVSDWSNTARGASGAASESTPASMLEPSRCADVVVRPVRRGGQQDRDVAVHELVVRSSGAVAKVVNGTTTAPMRAAASMRDHERRAVGVQQPDVGALARAEGDEPAGQLRRTALGVGVAEPVGVADQQRVFAALSACSAQHRAATVMRLSRPREVSPHRLRSGLPDGVRGIVSTIAISVGIS